MRLHLLAMMVILLGLECMFMWMVKARDTLDAFLLSYQLYVAVWLEYPRKAALSLKFIEMVIFGQPGTPLKKLADLLNLSNIDYK